MALKLCVYFTSTTKSTIPKVDVNYLFPSLFLNLVFWKKWEQTIPRSLVKGFSAERKPCMAENVKSLNYII